MQRQENEQTKVRPHFPKLEKLVGRVEAINRKPDYHRVRQVCRNRSAQGCGISGESHDHCVSPPRKGVIQHLLPQPPTRSNDDSEFPGPLPCPIFIPHESPFALCVNPQCSGHKCSTSRNGYCIKGDCQGEPPVIYPTDRKAPMLLRWLRCLTASLYAVGASIG